MGLKDFILQAIASFKPIQITNNVESVNLGGKQYKVEKGNIIFESGGVEERIPLKRDAEGFYRPVIEGVVVEGLAEEKKDNVEGLDVDEKIFTRADLGSPQLEILKVTNDELVKKLTAVLRNYQTGSDLGALLAAVAMVRVENAKKDRELSAKLHTNFGYAYKSRGAMIYNLLRSEILADEIVKHLEKLSKIYKPAEVTTQFLFYWDSILTTGYPTAHFVRHEDNAKSVAVELDRRFKNGAKMVRIFSRTITRNRDVRQWCHDYCTERKLRMSKGKEYTLGFSPAIKINIYNRPK